MIVLQNNNINRGYIQTMRNLRNLRNLRSVALLLIPMLILTGCFKGEKKEQVTHTAIAIESSDECHLCGMLITRFDGPKGELFRNEVSEEEAKKARKFCSTRDMFSYYLDPEHTRNVTTILVHDMSKSPWDTPNDDYFINAKTAWFVSGSSKKGAMGKTLASFSSKQDAETFAKEFGGTVLSFDDITLSTLL